MSRQKGGCSKPPEEKFSISEIIRWVEASLEESERCYKSLKETVWKEPSFDGVVGLHEAKGVYDGKRRAYQAVLEMFKRCKENLNG
jgi:hypothetical protein